MLRGKYHRQNLKGRGDSEELQKAHTAEMDKAQQCNFRGKRSPSGIIIAKATDLCSPSASLGTKGSCYAGSSA